MSPFTKVNLFNSDNEVLSKFNGTSNLSKFLAEIAFNFLALGIISSKSLTDPVWRIFNNSNSGISNDA